MFQVDEEAEGLQASILSCSTDTSLLNKLTNKVITTRTNGPLEGGGSTTQQGTKSSTSSNNEMTH